MFVLALTTSTARCSVALLDGDRLVASTDYEDEMKHAERLFPTLDVLLADACRTPGDLEAVICDIGPGSFTGVRVSVASAKGIAVALSVPLIGVCSLEAMSAAAFLLAPDGVELVACMIDAKRGETFFAMYDRDRRQVLEPAHAPAGAALAALGEHGDKAELAFCGRAARREVGSERLIEDPSCELPSAEHIGRIGIQLLAAGVAVEDIEPLYVRAPDAKLPGKITPAASGASS